MQKYGYRGPYQQQQQTPVAPASKKLWRYAENQRRRRWQDFDANADADAPAMSSPMPPPSRNDPGRDNTYSGGAMYYYWGDGPNQYLNRPPAMTAECPAASESQRNNRVTMDHHYNTGGQAGDWTRANQGWQGYGDRGRDGAEIRGSRHGNGNKKRGYEKKWHSG